MEAQIGIGLTGQELIAFLKDNADKIEEMTYMRYFDKSESEELKNELSENMIKLNDISEEEAEIRERFKEQKKPLVKRKKEILQELKWNGEKVTEEVYRMDDPDKKVVGYYNKFGKLINSRAMNPGEFLGSIMPLSRASNQ